MLLLVVDKCSVCNETVKEDTTWGDEIYLTTKSIHLFLWSNPRFSLVKWCNDKPVWLGLSIPFSPFCFHLDLDDCSRLCTFSSYYFYLSPPFWCRFSTVVKPCSRQDMAYLYGEDHFTTSMAVWPIVLWFLDKFKSWTAV